MHPALDASGLCDRSPLEKVGGVVAVAELHGFVIDNEQPAADDDGHTWWEFEPCGDLGRCRRFLDGEKLLSGVLPLGGGLCVEGYSCVLNVEEGLL
ncbi:MAG: hypothetical protein M3Z25_17070 [Actinomycetota bacterium]|nr:hypothetical protein [Actinomycetota bacterium]